MSILCLQVLNGIILQSLELFRKQEVDFLIATDVAARVSIRSKQLIFKILFSVVSSYAFSPLEHCRVWSFQGLDIIGVQTVINYACPREIDRYIRDLSCIMIKLKSSQFSSLYLMRGQYVLLWFCSYVHRVGRTARAGREGYAVTFVTDSDRSLLKVIVSISSDIHGSCFYPNHYRSSLNIQINFVSLVTRQRRWVQSWRAESSQSSRSSSGLR